MALLTATLMSFASASPAAAIKCTTKAHDPHESHHNPGTINAEVRQTCDVAVDKNSTEARLWEKRWWGYNIIDQNFSDLKRRKVSKVFVNDHCRENWIRVTGHGHFEVNGVHFASAEVRNTKFIDC